MEVFSSFASSNSTELDGLKSITVLKFGTKTEQVKNKDNVTLRTLVKSFLVPKCLKTFNGDSEGIFDSPADMAKAVIKILQNNNVRFTKEDGEPETNEKNIIVFVSQMMYGQCRKIKKNRREQEQQQQPVHQHPYCVPVQQQPFQYIKYMNSNEWVCKDKGIMPLRDWKKCKILVVGWQLYICLWSTCLC